MYELGFEYKLVIFSCYVNGLLCYVCIYEFEKFVDKFICGVYIEVCFCECFVKFVLYVFEDLGKFYVLLLCFEVRYFEDYLMLVG